MKMASFSMNVVCAALFATALPAPSQAQQPAPQYNVITDAVLFDGGPSLGNSDRVRWDFYKADRAGGRTDDNAGGSYDATFEAKLPAGKYVGVAALGNVTREVPFEVRDGNVARPKVNFDAAELTIVPKRSPGGDVETQAKTEITRDDFKDSVYGQNTVFVPAGEVLLTGRIGPARAEEKLAIKAGEKISHELVIPSGVVIAKAVYAEGGRAVETDDIRFEAMSAKETLDGTRETINGIYGTGKMMEMPAGDFVMRARLGKVTVEQPFTVTAGKRTEITIDLDAGVLAIKAPGAERIDIVETTRDLQGTQKEISGRYGTQHQETLHPGEYSVKVSYDKKSGREPKEIKATVKAAERTETSVPE
ncbi:Ca-activated chloride channel family protein [Agrobacterium tumefaciens]|nr:Ca-activated chloride channel family protein [Agrobacterium tumefaciens]MBP2516220.1 Ca-activated chloride channel family protein [Agrobacterium tumefaciens]MBP2574853.1 Ca-activated chloride channel family protein [Agrobacterium tumefaciens]MBP2593520.1 Ca-activated chloride channel family protein [Agrobacterium tumefaciens]MDP9786627.1 Ca-activated chloride channel family protein [Agrobacterium tumefaciens]